MKPDELYAKAMKAAETAAVYKKVELAGEQRHNDGVGIVRIRPARGAFVLWCKKNDIGRAGDYGGWEISNPTQSREFGYEVSLAGAEAFARVLRDEGGLNAGYRRLIFD